MNIVLNALEIEFFHVNNNLTVTNYSNLRPVAFNGFSVGCDCVECGSQSDSQSGRFYMLCNDCDGVIQAFSQVLLKTQASVT